MTPLDAALILAAMAASVVLPGVFLARALFRDLDDSVDFAGAAIILGFTPQLLLYAASSNLSIPINVYSFLLFTFAAAATGAYLSGDLMRAYAWGVRHG